MNRLRLTSSFLMVLALSPVAAHANGWIVLERMAETAAYSFPIACLVGAASLKAFMPRLRFVLCLLLSIAANAASTIIGLAMATAGADFRPLLAGRIYWHYDDKLPLMLALSLAVTVIVQTAVVLAGVRRSQPFGRIVGAVFVASVLNTALLSVMLLRWP